LSIQIACKILCSDTGACHIPVGQLNIIFLSLVMQKKTAEGVCLTINL